MSTVKFGRYEIKSELGRGGMATVFHAYDPRFERDVAIKVLPREFLHDTQFRVRFDREAKTIALLEHPAIVPVYDFGEEEAQPYIVMRYMSGGSLADRLQKGPLSLEEAVRLYVRLAPALDAAHAKSIIHRDLKPGNILFDQYGNSFLADFGIARLAQAGSSTLTGGNILGTAAYMSPEQVQGDKELDGRSDIYAMGVILYQVLTGSAPYQSTTPARVMMMHILEPVPKILTAKSDLPPTIQIIIEKAMAKEPDQRYVNLSEMAAEMEELVNATGPRPRISSHPQPAAAGATMVAQPLTAGMREQRTPAPTGLAPTAIGAPPITGPIPRAAPQARRGIPGWAIALIAILVLGMLGATAVGGYMIFGPKAATPTTAVALVQPTDTSAPPPATDTPEPTPIPPTNTAEVIVPVEEPTETPVPEPTVTETPAPTENTRIIIGSTDKIAFVNRNDIWIVNPDGSELQQITNDGAEKRSLQWGPGGDYLVYVSGKCVKTVNVVTGVNDIIACYNNSAILADFQISPDGTHAAVSLDNEHLYVVRYDIQALKATKNRGDLVSLGDCKIFAPYDRAFVKLVRWSGDSSAVGFVYAAPSGNTRVDTIKVLNVSNCTEPPARVGVEFPSEWFKMKGYNVRPEILHFGWNGAGLFVLNGIIRNDGYGDLYVFNMELFRADLEINPIGGNCCYRDAQFSPDGSYLAFAYQEISSLNKIQLYYVPYGAIGTGARFNPIPLPDDFFPSRAESPQPVMRPAQP